MNCPYLENRNLVSSIRRSIEIALMLVCILSWSQAGSGIAQESAIEEAAFEEPQHKPLEGLSSRNDRSIRSTARDVSIKIDFNVVYGQTDPAFQVADIYRPDTNEVLPGIILIHGGAWMAGDKMHDAMHARDFASAGFVVMAINYRLAPKHKHPAQLDDCWSAFQWLIDHRSEYAFDPERTGAWGYSAGGHLSALLATNPREGFPRLKVSVAGGAPCDFTLIPANNRWLVPFLGTTRAQNPALYREASPISYVTADDPPMLLFHGSTDWLVPPRSTEVMQHALDRANVVNERYVVDGKAHIMTFVDPSTREKSIEFLIRYLK